MMLDIHNTKFTLLGEMFENIIHQFKQPLSAINTEATGIKFQHENDMLSDDELYQSMDTISQRANFLSETIEAFQDFLTEDKVKTIFKIKKNIEKIEMIIEPTLKAKGIEVYKYFSNDNIEYNGFDREFSQVIINLLNNAKDAILINNPTNKIIKIDIDDTEDELVIKISDNAGGIDKSIISKVFDSYFTTKKDSGGTGIGLSMSKTIIQEHFNGNLSVENIIFKIEDNDYFGACFTIRLPK
jgi:signal transduction histidine kinase